MVKASEGLLKELKIDVSFLMAMIIDLSRGWNGSIKLAGSSNICGLGWGCAVFSIELGLVLFRLPSMQSLSRFFI
jgi:hypothetical protein